MKKIAFLSFILLTLFGCRKDLDETVSTTVIQDDPKITVIDYEPEVIEVTATLFGEVFNEAGVPINNASLNLDGNTTTTDEKGRFLFKDITMNQAGTYVEANKNGYFTGSHRFFPESGTVNYAKIILLEKEETGNFVAGDGGMITSAEGISINFPANSVVTSAGDLYQGTVSVSARWIDPTADNLLAIMPGNLQGIMRGGAQNNGSDWEEVAIASFGMMAVELESASGEALNLGNNLQATLSFPVPAELQSNAPSEIPLWYFNETYGIWVHEGTATLQGDNYIGDVAHFSFWNCDDPYELVEVSGTLVTNGGIPVAYANVVLTMISSGETGFGYSDSEGHFSGKVPIDEEFEMNITYNFNCIEYLQNIGPFSVDTDLGDITLSSLDILDITCTIDNCSGAPLSSGYLEIVIDNQEYTFYIDDGSDVSFSIPNCNDVTELTATAINLDDLEQSSTETYAITNPLDLGNIDACGIALPEWLIINGDGVETTFADVSAIYDDVNDTLYITATLPSTNFNVELRLNSVTTTVPTTYNNTNVDWASISLESGSGGFFSTVCGNFTATPCTFDGLTISQIGAVGTAVVGEFDGTLDFLDDNQQVVTHYVNATFNIIRD